MTITEKLKVRQPQSWQESPSDRALNMARGERDLHIRCCRGCGPLALCERGQALADELDRVEADIIREGWPA